LASLRAIPNMTVIRPADANETVAAWKLALERRHAPTVLALTRQNVSTINRSLFAPASELEHGAYILADLGSHSQLDLILMASGSEVGLIVEAGRKLAAQGLAVRLISFPSWELFNEQSQEYRDKVLPVTIKARLAVEAGVSMGWEHWVGERGAVLAVDRFGASAPAEIVYRELGLTVENIVTRALSLVR
jgi:transketolase